MALVLFVLLAAFFDLYNTHTVAICWDLKSKPGSLVIWQEHWHGDQTAAAPYGILFSNPTEAIDFSKWKLTPHGWRNNLSRAQLQAMIPGIQCNFCNPPESDWFFYEFPACIFGASGLGLTVNGDQRIVITEPSVATCATRVTIPKMNPPCPDLNKDNRCDNCNCVSCTGTPYDSVCGNGKRDNGEDCDDLGTQCTNCKCNAGWMPNSPPTKDCKLADPCVNYGYSGKQDNTKSCTNINGGTARTIVCNAGYYVLGTNWEASVTLQGAAAFTGCADINECAAYGFNGKIANTLTCDNSAINQRTITCQTGYVVVGQNNAPKVVLTGPAVFTGCADLDECVAYSYSGNGANALDCKDGLNQRTITCKPGYYVTGTVNLPSKVFVGAATFPGCSDLDECAVYGYQPKPEKAVMCVQGINQRTITCDVGYYIAGRLGGVREAVFIGNAPFVGCSLRSTCTDFGFSGKPEHTSTCVDGVNQRTLTCMAGYYVTAPINPTITLMGDAAFTGCFNIDECKQWGFSGKDANTDKCVEGVNKRTITCKDGYAVKGGTPTQKSIDLIADAPFQGCVEIDECIQYGYAPGTNKDTIGCVDKVNARVITCQPGFKVGKGNALATGSTIELIGAATFPGCFDINECAVYGFSGKNDRAVKCENQVNSRTITCDDGFFATAPDTKTVTLIGAAPFKGCSDIDECTVYGYNGKTLGTDTCNQGINKRVIRCLPGYSTVAVTKPPPTALITIVGNAPFQGCIDVDECALYGFSGRADNTASCVQGIDQRTISCAKGFRVVSAQIQRLSITLLNSSPFPGCEPWCGDGLLKGGEQCDDGNNISGDGCSEICVPEPGWDCGNVANQGLSCCPALEKSVVDYGLAAQLECRNYWWISNTATDITINREDATLELTETLHLCGEVVIGHNTDGLRDVELRNRHHSLLVNNSLVIGGSLTVLDSGSIFWTVDGAINITTCEWGTVKWEGHEYQQLSVTGTGLLAMENFHWDTATEDDDQPLNTPGPRIFMNYCAHLDGAFYLQSDHIPGGNHDLPVVWSQTPCIVGRDEDKSEPFPRMDAILPGSCSRISTHIEYANAWVTVQANGLCDAQLAGIVLGSVGGALVVAGGAYALTAGSTGGVETGEYLAL